MNVFLFKHREFEALYNCSSYRVEDVPLEMRTYPILGYTLMILGIIAELAYIPCCTVMWRSEFRTHSCYKFMMMLSVIDVFSIPVVGIATGFFGTQGYVYCSAPTLLYYMGCYIALTWISHSCLAFLLAVNRCMSVHHASLTALLFDGNKPYYWAIPSFMWGAYFAIYTRVPFFNGMGFSWFFDPHFGYLKTLDTRYYSYQHAYHNMFICFGTISVYTLFFIIMCKNWNRTGRKQTDTQKSVFLQVFLISLCTCVATATYVVMNFEFAPAILTVVSSFTYFGIHGVPPFIYLVLNDTIRKRIRKIVRKGDSKTTVVPPTV